MRPGEEIGFSVYEEASELIDAVLNGYDDRRHFNLHSSRENHYFEEFEFEQYDQITDDFRNRIREDSELADYELLDPIELEALWYAKVGEDLSEEEEFHSLAEGSDRSRRKIQRSKRNLIDEGFLVTSGLSGEKRYIPTDESLPYIQLIEDVHEANTEVKSAEPGI